MRNKNVLLYIIWIAMLSCNSSGKITKRYKRITIEKNDAKIKEYVGVKAFIKETAGADPAKPKTIFDLTERGQKELIKQLGINEPANDKLIASLTSALSARQQSSIDLIDYTKTERQVNVSISNLSHWPADRISKLTVRLKLAADFQLISCNKLVTEYQTLDLGKQTYSNTAGVEVNANVGYGANIVNGNTNANEQNSGDKVDEFTGSKSTSSGSNSKTITAGIGASGKFNASRSFGEEVQLRQRIIALNVSIADNTLSLYQESISGINLSGNITADIVFDSKKDIKVERTYSISELSTNGTINDPAALKVKETLVQYFNFDKDVTATLSYDADFRHVASNGSTTSESDDVVELYYGTVKAPKPIVLLSKDQLKPKLWVLYDKTDLSKKPVKIFSPNVNGNGELIFSSYSDAKDFLAWLLLKNASLIAGANGGKVGPAGHVLLKSDGSAIDAATINNLVVGVSQ